VKKILIELNKVAFTILTFISLQFYEYPYYIEFPILLLGITIDKITQLTYAVNSKKIASQDHIRLEHPSGSYIEIGKDITIYAKDKLNIN
jgi:hypothetical protein